MSHSGSSGFSVPKPLAIILVIAAVAYFFNPFSLIFGIIGALFVPLTLAKLAVIAVVLFLVVGKMGGGAKAGAHAGGGHGGAHSGGGGHEGGHGH